MDFNGITTVEELFNSVLAEEAFINTPPALVASPETPPVATPPSSIICGGFSPEDHESRDVCKSCPVWK